MDNKKDQDQSQRFTSIEKITPHSNGWLSPSGKYFKCSPEEHNEAARFITDNDLLEINREGDSGEISHLRREKMISSRVPRTILEYHGYILVRDEILPSVSSNITTKQMDMLKEANVTFIVSSSHENNNLKSYEYQSKIFVNKAKKIINQTDYQKARQVAMETKMKYKIKRFPYDTTLLPSNIISKHDADDIASTLEQYRSGSFYDDDLRNITAKIRIFGSLNDFVHDPFRSAIGLDCYEGDTVSKNSVFEIFEQFTNDTQESISLKSSYESSVLKIYQIPNSDLLTVITFGEYRHRGDAQQFSEPDRRYSVSAHIYEKKELINILNEVTTGDIKAKMEIGKDNNIITAEDLF